MARLDRLGGAKEVAQIGAVIGREFARRPSRHDRVGSIRRTLQEAHSPRLTTSAIVFDRG